MSISSRTRTASSSGNARILPNNSSNITARAKMKPLNPCHFSSTKLQMLLIAASLILTTAFADEESFTADLLRFACRHPYRKVKEQVYDLTPRFFDDRQIINQSWRIFSETPVGDFNFIFGKVLSVDPEGILIRKFDNYYDFTRTFGQYEVVFIKNFPFSVVDDQTIAAYAVRSGTYSYNSAGGALKTVHGYDFGTTPSDQELADAKAKAKERAENYRNAMATQKAAADAAQAKKEEQGKAAAIKFLKEKAADGGAMSQYSLAQKYLKGDGVPIDVEQAKAWLRASCTNGYSDACALLQKIAVGTTSTSPQITSKP
jgi:hypothetical protein